MSYHNTGTGFDSVRTFVRNAISRMPVASSRVRLGLISYSSSAVVALNFTTGSSSSAAIAAVNAMPCAGGAMRTDLALQVAREVLLNPFTSRRANVDAVLVFVTPGGATLPFAVTDEIRLIEQVPLLSRYVLAIGVNNQFELLNLAGGSSSHVATASNGFADVAGMDDSFFTSDVCEPCSSTEFVLPLMGACLNFCCCCTLCRDHCVF